MLKHASAYDEHDKHDHIANDVVNHGSFKYFWNVSGVAFFIVHTTDTLTDRSVFLSNR